MYECIDCNGPAQLPNRDQVIQLASQDGITAALILDANVCLDLADLGRDQPHPDRESGIRKFVREVAASGVSVVTGFGLAELCLQRESWELDVSRHENLERNISAAIDFAPKLGQRSPFSRPAGENSDFQESGVFKPWVPTLQVYYASLLKVSALSRTGLNRASAFRNLEAYVKWASREFGDVAILPLQAAIAIFGGDSRARGLIGAGSSKRIAENVWDQWRCGAWRPPV